MNKYFWQIKLFRKKIKLYFVNMFYKILIYCFPRRNEVFEPSKIKNILIARNDKIGDMVVTTALIKNLAIAGYEVYVSSQLGSLDIVKHSPYVKGIYSYNDSSIKELFQTIKKIRKKHFDLVIDSRPYYSFEIRKIIFCAFTKSTHLMGFNKSNVKTYNISISYYDHHAHITQQFNCIYPYLNIKNFVLDYDLNVTDNNEKYVTNFINKNNITKFIVVNPFGGARKRELSKWQMEYIVLLLKRRKPDDQIIFIGESSKLISIDDNLGIKFISNSILDVISLIKRASYVVTVDTSIVHITSAFRLSCLTIYSETILHENTDNLNLTMRKKWKEYYRLACNELVDKPYLKKHKLSIELPCCYDELWAPNNLNAKQIVFYKSFLTKVDKKEFAKNIKDYLI